MEDAHIMVDQTAEGPLAAPGPERSPVEDHIALIYNEDEERLTTITPLIKVGLEKGELCLYISDEENDLAIVDALKAENIDVDKAVSNGSLILTSKKEMYFKLGRFDPEWTIRVINNIADLARSYGFTAMRVMSEMKWTQDKVPGVERWPEYEAKMNALKPGLSLRIICQYDRRSFAPEAMMAAIQTHPRIVADGQVNKNSFYIPSDRLLKGDYAEAELERVMENIRTINSSDAALQERNSTIESMSRQADADSAARKGLEMALEESRRRFRELAERTSDWAWELDEHGRYAYSSPRVRDILGLQPEDIIGRTPTDLVSKETAEHIAKMMSRIMSSRSPISALELEARHKDGHIVYLEMSGTPYFDHDGRFLGFRGVDRDISGRKASKQAIEESRKRTEESLAEIRARDERISVLDSEMAGLKASLSELDSSIAALQGDMDSKQAELATATEGLSRLNESLRTRENEIRSLKAAHDEKASLVDSQAREMTGLRKQLDERGGELIAIQATLAAAQTMLQGKASELEALTSSFKSQTLELKGARESLSGVEETLAHREQEQFAMRQHIERLEADLMAAKDSLATRSEELGKAQQELSEARATVDQRAVELAAVNDTLAMKVKDLAAADELAEQRARELASARETIERREAELAANVTALELRIAELATAQGLAESRAGEVMAANGRIRELDSDLTAAQAELSSAHALAEQRAGNIAAAEESISKLTAELADLRETVGSKDKELEAFASNLEQRISDLRAANELVEKRDREIAAARELHGQVAAALAAAEARLVGSEDELSTARSEIEDLKASVASRSVDLEVLARERDARDEEIARILLQKSELEAALASRGAELSALGGTAQRTASELTAAQAELSSVRARLSERERDLAGASSRADMLGKVLVLKEEELSSTLTSFESSKHAASVLSSKAMQLEADQNVSAVIIEGMRAAMADSQARTAKALEDGETSIGRLKAAVADKERVASERMGQMIALNARIRELEAARDAASSEAERMRRAFMGLPVPAAMVAIDGRVAVANLAMERAMASGNLEGKIASEIWPGLDISEAGSVRFSREGQEMEMRTLASVIRDGSRDIGTMLAFGEPVPVKTGMDQEVSPEALAHDLNDSLQVIMGSVSLAKEYVIPEGRMYSKLKRIESASATARDLAGKLMSPAREGHLPAPEAPSNLTRGKGRLLLMDDDENVLEATSDLLRYLGYNVEVSRDGEEAVAMCKEAEEIWQSYDLALIDISISSGMGGMEASRRLMSLNPRIVLIATSGYLSDPIVADPSANGFAAALSKPYSAELLSKTIAEVLAKRPA